MKHAPELALVIGCPTREQLSVPQYRLERHGTQAATPVSSGFSATASAVKFASSDSGSSARTGGCPSSVTCAACTRGVQEGGGAGAVPFSAPLGRVARPAPPR